MVVTIDRDQQIFLNDQPINIHDLPEKLHQAGVDPAHQSIYLRGDETVPFGAFASVMDAVKQAGITNVSIVTQPLETKGTAEQRQVAGWVRGIPVSERDRWHPWVDGNRGLDYMSSVLEGSEHLERELTPEPIAGPAAGSLVLHVVLAACLVYYGWVLGLFHHNLWGNPGAGGAMQVSLVSSALPLPAERGEQECAGHGDAEPGAGCAQPKGTAARG